MVVELRTSRARTSSSLLVLCLTLLLAWLILSPWIASSAIPDIQSDPELLRAWRAHPSNPAYGHRLRGGIRQFSIALQDYHEALREYQLALVHRPLSSRTWFDLARARSWVGKTQEAHRDLNLALRFNPTDARLRWEAALLQIQFENLDEAIENLRYLIRIDRTRRWEYFAFLRTLTTPSDLLDTIIPPERELLSDYLDYLIRHEGAITDAKVVWKRLVHTPGRTLDSNLILSYADLMIDQREMAEAQSAWTLALTSKGLDDRRRPHNLLWNSSFEHDETLGRGFDWRIRFVPGAEIKIDAQHSKEGGRSLRISFDGSRNVDLSGVWQVVRVKPNARYRLGGHVKTSRLTTSNGVRIEALDLRGERRYGVTEELVANHDWFELTTSFVTSPTTDAVVVRVRREPSQRLDNLIEGTAWVDQVYLTEVSSSGGSASEGAHVAWSRVQATP